MSEPNNNNAAMVNDHDMIHDTETMFQDCEMILGNDEMVQSNETIIGDKMGHDGERIPDYKLVDIHDGRITHGCDMILGSEMIHSNQVVINGSDTAQGTGVANGNDTAEVKPTTIHGSEMVHGIMLGNGNDTAEVTPPTTSRRRRKTSSIVWEHFTKEVYPEGSIRACCNHCKKILAYSSGSKVVGTSHLKRHITDSCPVLKDHGPLLAGGTDTGAWGTAVKHPKRRCTAYANASFNQDRSSSYLAKMIILHNYPLHIAQQPSFISFVEDLQPRFKAIQMYAMEAEVYAIYLKEKDNLLMEFGNIPGRINLTVGSWTTSQTLGYVSIAGQFIDLEWKLR
ncbi:hypothetical protein QOZ80_1BG0068180 [Eleusine coracana subsp. coracana]|nr:hypothetical protein QOZ80_1BG0068180 [Eleusine coracana subsp. coracana]